MKRALYFFLILSIILLNTTGCIVVLSSTEQQPDENTLNDRPSSPKRDDLINFDSHTIRQYTAQGNKGAALIEENGLALHIDGDGWYKIDFPYTVSENTALAFDFKSSREGEIHSIGFDDDDDNGNAKRSFKLFGTQDWHGNIITYDFYIGSGRYKHYFIPVGEFYTGAMSCLFFGNDHDQEPNNGESYFSNVRVYECSVEKINFANLSIDIYTDQNVDGSASVEDRGASLWIAKNGWYKVDFPYELSATTVLTFDFRSSVEGEIHAIGFDDDNDNGDEKRSFKVFGTQDWEGNITHYDTYDGSGKISHYVIPVGEYYTGTMSYLFFGNDHDAAPNNGESYFSNIRIYNDLPDNGVEIPAATQ